MATRTKKKTAQSEVPSKPLPPATPATAPSPESGQTISPSTSATTNEFAGLRISALEFIEALKQLPKAE